MKISTKGRYAVRLMLDVAIHGMDTWHGAIGFSKIKGKITQNFSSWA